MQRVSLYSPFEEQPGQCLLIDITTPEKNVTKELSDSVKAVLRLNFLSDAGFPRIPLFSLIVWNGTGFQILFDFQNLNISINDAYYAVDNLAKLQTSANVPQSSDFKTFLLNFVAQSRDTLVYARKKPDVTVISACDEFCTNLIDLLKDEDVDASLSSMFGQLKLFHLSSSVPSFDTTSGFSENGSLIFSVCSIISHPVTFDRIFRQWLSDQSISCPQLQLKLPSMTDGSISCDVMETMLLPDDLLFKTTKPAKVPVRNLTACYRIPSNRFAHDMLYGCPFKVVPTSCWKMEWEELSINKELFENLCQSLIANDEILVFQNTHSNVQIDPFYLFFPEKTSAILSPVVCSELALPMDRQEPVADFESVSLELKNQIEMLPSLDYWNPFIHVPKSAKVGILLSKVEK